jgi:hypothetical protein
LRIEHAIRLIAASPTLFGNNHDPIALTRAVNSLHALGKDEAIVALRRFAAQNSSLAYDSPILFIGRLLYDYADPEDRFPWRQETKDRRAFSTMAYYANCIVAEEGDIPFRYQSIFYFGTRPESSLAPAIDWAEKHGRLRTTPLRPTDSPLAAADELLEQLQSKFTAKESSNKRLLREQALRAVTPLLTFPDFDAAKLTLENDDDWQRLKEEIHRLGVRWSETRQCYVRSKTQG